MVLFLLLQSPPLPLRYPSFPPLLPSRTPPHRRAVAFHPTVGPSIILLQRRRSFPCLSLRTPHSLPTSDQDLLQTISGLEDGEEAPTHLPAVRSYESDLARLTLVGAVGYDQAVTAAAADGGDAAQEHLSSGTPTMVVETLFPGSMDEHSTVSTRLFLPAREVKEKAKKLRSRLTMDMLSSNMSRNILAMTFRQVVLQHVWSMELVMFPPGVERDMEDLTNPREIPTFFTISSPEGNILAAIAEVICSFAFDCVEKEHLRGAGSTARNGIFSWFQKPLITCSSDSSVCLSRIPKSEVLEEAKKRVHDFNLASSKYSSKEKGLKHKWLVPPTYSGVSNIGAHEASTWINELIPAYKIQVDGNKFKDAKFQGWQKTTDNRWEASLTHCQMAGLANILDMFYEDRFTLPEKQLLSSWTARLSNASRVKNSLWKMVLVMVYGCALVSFGIVARYCSPRLFETRKDFGQHSVSISDINCSQIQSFGTIELESFCTSIVEKIKDALGRPGDIVFDATVGAWTGELPSYLRASPTDDAKETAISKKRDATDSSGPSTSSPPLSGKDFGMHMTSAQDIASYQVVLNIDGQIIGFQPTSRVAVNNWATNPLSKVLYQGKTLSPGLLEPSLKIPQPDKIVLIELLMSVNPQSWFVLARPFSL